MSNRRRLASEKAARPRCRRCKGREFAHKTFSDGTVRVCMRCEDISNEPARDEEQA